MTETTTIKVTKKLYERLKKEGNYGESMSDIIENIFRKMEKWDRLVKRVSDKKLKELLDIEDKLE